MGMEIRLERVTDKNYPAYLEAPASVVLFKIANCAKCEEFAPLVQEASERFDGKIRFGMALLHVPGACREIKRLYRFETFPTTHFYRAGRLVHQEGRKLSAEELASALETHLLK